jgi:hypothetical protein
MPETLPRGRFYARRHRADSRFRSGEHLQHSRPRIPLPRRHVRLRHRPSSRSLCCAAVAARGSAPAVSLRIQKDSVRGSRVFSEASLPSPLVTASRDSGGLRGLLPGRTGIWRLRETPQGARSGSTAPRGSAPCRALAAVVARWVSQSSPLNLTPEHESTPSRYATW